MRSSKLLGGRQEVASNLLNSLQRFLPKLNGGSSARPGVRAESRP